MKRLTLALAALAVAVAPAFAGTTVVQNTQAQCLEWSEWSDMAMGGCRASYMNGNMSTARAAQCCGYRETTIKAWVQCTKFFGPVDWRSLNESKQEWGCTGK